MIKGFGFLAMVVVSSLLIISYTFGKVVPPGELGVRQISFGPYQGFSKEGLRPGYHWSVPFYSTVHLVPQVIQTLHLARTNQDEEPHGSSVEVQTTDGSSVDVDITVLSRFYPESAADHGGPSELIQKFGTNKTAWIDRLRTASINEIRKALGRLSTSEFYDPHKREEAVKDAQKLLDQRMAEFGIKIEAILLRRYTYTEERIDAAIFQKNLQDQEERLNTAKSLFSKAKADLEKISAEWDARIMTLSVDGDNKVRVIRSEADLYETQKRAEGDFLVAKARAEVDKLKATALATSAGAKSYVAKELAPLLSSLKGGIVSELDPYNLNQWISKMGAANGQ